MSRGNIYCCQLYVYLLSEPRITLLQSNHNQLLKHLLFALKFFFLIRFLYIFVLWEVSTGDAVMTTLFFQSLCHALSSVAALMI